MEGLGQRRQRGYGGDQRGFVLVTVLIVIALLLPAVLVFYSKAQVNLAQAANFRDSIQAIRLARSGVEGAIGILKADDASYDGKGDRWALRFPALGVGTGMLEVRIDDEDGKLNLNTLLAAAGDKDVVNRQVEERLRKLITRLGGRPEVVDSLIDWMDRDDKVYGDQGAEESYYRERGQTVKNGPLDSLDELLRIRGFDRDLLVDRRLLDYVTVAPTDGKLNVNTAPAELLLDLHPDLREGLVEEIVRRRDEKDFTSMNDLKGVIGLADPLAARLDPLVKVNSFFFTIRAKYTAGNVVKQVESLVRRDGGMVTILSWREF